MIILGDVRCIYLRKIQTYFSVFKEYKAWLELKLPKKIKCLRIDNGREFTDGKFLVFCKQKGIRR